MTAKRALWIFALATAILLFLNATGRCKIPPKTPGDTPCKAEMNAETCKKFQDLLKQYGHDLTVIEGTAFATVKQTKQNTFTAFLKCRDAQGNIYCVIVRYLKDKFVGVEVKPTGEKWTGM